MQSIIAIITIVVAIHLHNKEKSEEKEKADDTFKTDVKDRLVKSETKLDMLLTLYPQLKALEKLENYEKLNLNPEDLRSTVSEIVDKNFYDFDKGITTLVTQKFNEISSKVEEDTNKIRMEFGSTPLPPLKEKPSEELKQKLDEYGHRLEIKEELILEPDTGRVLNPTFVDYPIPTALDYRNMDRVIIVESMEKLGPYGAKGIGECALSAAAPAISNAIFNAIGVRIKLPATPDKVLKALSK